LYVADSNIVARDTSESGSDDQLAALRQELAWLGQVLLSMAKEQAALSGVDATLHIREGTVVDEIVQFAREQRASGILIGAPRGTSSDVFGDDPVEELAAAIESEAGTPVEIVRPDVR
jgi:hypothetical protein